MFAFTVEALANTIVPRTCLATSVPVNPESRFLPLSNMNDRTRPCGDLSIHHPFSDSDRLLTLSSEYLHQAGIIGFGREFGRDDGSYPSP